MSVASVGAVLLLLVVLAAGQKQQPRRAVVWSREVRSLPQQHSPCHFGELPGLMNYSAQPGSRYQLYNTDCQLENLLVSRSAPVDDGMDGMARSSADFTKQQLSVLLLGDSVDWYALATMCEVMNGTLVPYGALQQRNYAINGRRDMMHCSASGNELHIGMHHLPGVHPTGARLRQ